YTTYVLYGNGVNQVPFGNKENNMGLLPVGWAAMQATPANLQTTFQNVGKQIAQDNAAGIKDDQFLFYATDHGGNTKVVGAGAGGGIIPGAGGPPGSYGTIQLESAELLSILADPSAQPTLTLEYSM